MRAVERPYKFAELSEFDRSYQDLPGTITTPYLRDSVDAYVANMHQLGCLPVLITNSIYWSGVIGRAAGWGPMPLGSPVADIMISGDDEFIKAFKGRILAMHRQASAMPEDQISRRMWMAGTSFLEGAGLGPEAGLKHFKPGVNALYNALVLNAYAAFEGLVKDAWIAVLSRNPNSFGTYDQIVKTNTLTRIHQELSAVANPGEYLIEKGYALFGSQKSILKSYGDTFGCSSDVYKALDPTVSPEVWKAEKIRHIIAHRSGKVDQKFKDAMTPEYESVPIGSPLPLDGLQVATLIDTCIKTSVRLLGALDAWCVQQGTTT